MREASMAVNMVVSEDVEDDDDDVEDGDEADISAADSDEADGGDEVLGNAGWADAMAKVLKSQLPKKKKVAILAKAKKESQITPKQKSKIEVVKEDGEVAPLEEEEEKPLKKPRLDKDELIARKDKKDAWENMARVKPSPLDKDKERALMRLATKGVVQLFNAVKQQQKMVQDKVKSVGGSEVKREKVLETLNKGAFLDMLKGTEKKNGTETKKEVKSEQVEQQKWSALRDDFMMDAKIKDWDKDEAD